MTLEPATADRAVDLAALHGASFDAPWTAAAIKALLEGPGGYGFVVLGGGGRALGFVLARAVAGEAEILTLAVEPGHRRRGLAHGLVEAAALFAGDRGAEALLLEVAVDNPAAIGLYRGAGFAEVGRRKGYYSRAGNPAIDALVMRRDLNTAPA